MSKAKIEAVSDDEREFWRDELREAAHLIEFLHGCLTDKQFQYAYPKQTLEHLKRIDSLSPPRQGCHHGRFHAGCDGCESSLAVAARRDKFRKLLRATKRKDGTR